MKFHEPLLALQGEIEVVEFKDVIHNFPESIARVNQRFGMSLDNYSDDHPLDKDAIFKRIEDINKSFNKEKLVETMVSRPSEERKKTQEELREVLVGDPKYKEKLAQCFAYYNRLTK